MAWKKRFVEGRDGVPLVEVLDGGGEDGLEGDAANDLVVAKLRSGVGRGGAECGGGYDDGLGDFGRLRGLERLSRFLLSDFYCSLDGLWGGLLESGDDPQPVGFVAERVLAGGGLDGLGLFLGRCRLEEERRIVVFDERRFVELLFGEDEIRFVSGVIDVAVLPVTGGVVVARLVMAECRERDIAVRFALAGLEDEGHR